MAKSFFRQSVSAGRSWPWLLAAGACLIALGCGSRGVPLEGKVTFRGAPVAEGSITFEPVGKGTVAQGPIVEGAYRAAVRPGKYRATFSAYQAAKTPGPDGKPHKIQYLPAKFTVDSQITVEVPRDGNKKLDFDLK